MCHCDIFLFCCVFQIQDFFNFTRINIGYKSLDLDIIMVIWSSSDFFQPILSAVLFDQIQQCYSL